jgi:streptogramin lyase
MRAAAWRSSILVPVLVLGACSATPSDPGSRAASESTDSEPSPSVASEAPSPSEPAGDSIEGRADTILDLVGEPDWPLEGFGSMWVLAPDQEEPKIVRIDPETNEVIASIQLPGQVCQGFAMSDDAVWACVTAGVVRIDPETNEITDEVAFETGAAWGSLAYGSGSVWALGAEGGVVNQLVRIDPAAMSATAIPLDHGVSTLAYGFDAVWVAAPQDGLVLRVDPATGEVTEHTADLARPQVIKVGPDSLWVTLQGAEEMPPDEPTVTRIDPADGSILAEIATGAAPGHLWADGDAIWVCARDQFLARIDPATDEVVETLSGPPSTCAVTIGFGSVWATAGNANKIYRFEP